MEFVVAFDGTPVSKTALDRTVQLADGVDGDVTAISVVPAGNAQYARQRGWVDAEDTYSLDAVVDTLRESVKSIAPNAAFVSQSVDRYAPRGKIGRVLRTAASESGVDVLVIGSANAGRVFTAVSTVTRSVANGSYDLYVVREIDSRFR
ncbi:MAG: universal stress protein [Halanaeroarchaeum sp.]